ncbi:UDP-4-amino-4,6-dideoxy-N-acetyl-beta-L-altrosamine N-acetyltransferase [Aquimarina sp. LLG6339-5]|uniref:UDP-4-amino-4, 6-dideoxy-N-acetyl-beta-L-altrosamine N-acetyltransferase n=1 Tax=Aquimarina sp. LLG6339-5 TaxID=3160830 RepID=UPI0038670800
MINRGKTYESGRLEFKNYTKLSLAEKRTILDFRNHELVRNMMNNNSIIELQGHLEFITRLKDDNHNYYWTVLKKEKIVGAVYLNKVDPDLRDPYWGIFLDPKYIGTGLGVEVEFESLTLFFNQFGLKKIKGEVLRNNIDSIQIQEKFLFKQIENETNNKYFQLQLTCEDWKELPKTYKEFKREILL